MYALICKAIKVTPLISCRYMQSTEAQDVIEHYERMLELLNAFKNDVYKEWTAGVDEACSFNLKQPLIKRKEVCTR